jgi:hypothetical protein
MDRVYVLVVVTHRFVQNLYISNDLNTVQAASSRATGVFFSCCYTFRTSGREAGVFLSGAVTELCGGPTQVLRLSTRSPVVVN